MLETKNTTELPQWSVMVLRQDFASNDLRVVASPSKVRYTERIADRGPEEETWKR